MLRKCYAKLRLPGKTIHGYRVYKQIGYGGFSVVYHCRERRTGRSYAMKVIEMAQYRSADSIDDVKNEVSLLRFLGDTGGPFISIIDDFEVNGFWYIIMQLADKGDLDQYSGAWERDNNGETLAEDDVADIMLDVFTGLQILHETCGYAHRDIKPDNIFLQSADSVDGTRALIGDFGLAREITFQFPDNSFGAAVGTIWFWAPETCQGVYGCAADVWASGITIWLLLCGDYPFTGVTNNPTAAKDRAFLRGIASLEERWMEGLNDGASHLSEEAWDFLKQVLDVNPDRRLSARRALDHPFLAAARAARDERYSPENSPTTTPSPERDSTPTPLPTPVPKGEPSAPPVTGEEADHPAGAPRRASEMAAEVLELIGEEVRARTREQTPVRRTRPDLIRPVKDNQTAIRKRTKRQVTPKVHRTRAAAAKKAETSVPPVVKARKPRALKPAAALPALEAPQGKSARDLRAERRARRKGL